MEVERETDVGRGSQVSDATPPTSMPVGQEQKWRLSPGSLQTATWHPSADTTTPAAGPPLATPHQGECKVALSGGHSP